MRYLPPVVVACTWIGYAVGRNVTERCDGWIRWIILAANIGCCALAWFHLYRATREARTELERSKTTLQRKLKR